MKKLFFFRSSSTSNGKKNNADSPPTDKQAYWEHQSEGGSDFQANYKSVRGNFHSPKGLFPKSSRQIDDIQSTSASPKLIRSRSLSSAAFLSGGSGQVNISGLVDQTRSPSKVSNGASYQQRDHPSRCRTLTPERDYNTSWFKMSNTRDAPGIGLERPASSVSSGNSSPSSSHVSSRILDRYIDGEQHEQRSRPNSNNGYGNSRGWKPPRVQHMAQTSPVHSIREKQRSHSFREDKIPQFFPKTGKWSEHRIEKRLPGRFAEDVMRIKTQDTCARPFLDSNSDRIAEKCFPTDEEAYSYDTEHDFEGERLQKRVQAAEERAMLLYDELDRESFRHGSGFDVPDLIQTIKNLTEERITMALEISGLLRSRISERASAKEDIRLAKAELQSITQKLEKEKSEMQSVLEKELDRRSTDWSAKLEKYRLEEERLRERVRELAEHNVSIQRVVSSYNEKEKERESRISYSEQKLKDLTPRMDEMTEENHYLQQNLAELEEKYRAEKEGRDCIARNLEEKENECKELHKSITRLLRTCGEQGKTIHGLGERFIEKFGDQPVEMLDKQVVKLQMEKVRLAGVELALRQELESCRIEVNSLQQENINMLSRLKDNGNGSGFLTLKLEKEMGSRIYCLQNQGLSLLNESSQYCAKLLEFIKDKAVQIREIDQGMEAIKNSLDGEFVMESEMKVQSFKRGTDSLTRSLQMASTFLVEKSCLAASEIHFQGKKADGSVQLDNQYSKEDVIRAELKAETLLTSLLREKLYSKEMEVEQLQALLATAVRGNSVLRGEIQNVMDNISCLTHKQKDLELQMLKKDEIIDRLQNDLHDSTKELAIVRGILPNISKDRDMMWDEVKHYSEKNIVLNSEVDLLKKKVETLDEQILLKEGQITILKDTLGNNCFDLLASPDSTREFLLQ